MVERGVVDIEMPGALEVGHYRFAVEADVGPQPLQEALQPAVDAEVVQQLLAEGGATGVVPEVGPPEVGLVVAVSPVLEDVQAYEAASQSDPD